MKKFLLLLTAFVACGWIDAQVIDRSGNKNFNVDYLRLAKIDSLVNTYVKNGWVKGVVTIIVKDNQLVQYKGYGYQDADTKKPMTSDVMFRIMSQTKAITSIGIMMLYEDGRLLLDQPVSDFIPEFKNQTVLDKYNAADTSFTTVPAKRGITIRDLLTHTSGIDYSGIGSEDMKAIYAKAGIPSGLGHIDMSLLEAMKILAKQPLKFQPGTRWQYGLNTDLLGCLIEVISGMSLETFCARRIFEPLGMKDTYFNVPPAKGSRLATVYTEDDHQQIIKWSHTHLNIDPDYPLIKTGFFSGGAGLTSTAYDYAIFLQMLLNKGKYNGKQILAPRTVELITTGQLDFSYNGTNNYGLAFEVVSEKGAAKGPVNKGSFAWGGYYGTMYWADPKSKLVCLVMTQHSPNSHGDLFSKFQSLVYASLKD